MIYVDVGVAETAYSFNLQDGTPPEEPEEEAGLGSDTLTAN